MIIYALNFAAPAHADELTDIDRLIRSSQYPAALSKADAFLSAKPRDPQMRFIKGVILTEMNRQQDAIVVFTRLTEDYPNLPEPFNNLAVLYAAQGQYEKARSALDKAIRTNPSYATAYENLGDIHARLASIAYDRALQLDSGNTSAKSKLTLVRYLAVNGAPPIQVADSKPLPKPAAAAAAPPVVAAPPAAAQKAAPAKLAAAPLPTPAAPPARPLEIAKAPAPQAKPEPAPPPKASQQKPARSDAERDAVMAAVSSWARAWSARDVKAYLGHYAADFDTPGNQSRKAWSDERQARIVGKGRISVRVEAPQVSIENNRATVRFRQAYVSDRLTANSRKTLVLVKQRGKWLIQKESTGN
ncbi:tetratricopeptide repeat protein [Lacisediminimonas sp.]|uniref:nuclear transport factor 2 family protein n=1 Tax=Lacisediminimonas sp. TaxID=3060582 RepID=UPI0027235FC3|nr:tetratricopeptide repeat protein [Lacisediminimonas sp.]MDO8299967.1 tetratricopeptide repeat protein [Lacisediminimonas sp.]